MGVGYLLSFECQSMLVINQKARNAGVLITIESKNA